MLCLPGSSDVLWGSSGQSPLCLGLSLSLCTCPSSYIRGTGESKGRKRSWKGLILCCSLLFPPPHLQEAVVKRTTHRLLSHSGVKQLPIFQNLHGENHPSCSCLQGQSAIFVPWMLNTRFIKVMLLLRRAMEMSQSLSDQHLSDIWPIDTHNRYIYPGNKKKTCSYKVIQSMLPGTGFIILPLSFPGSICTFHTSTVFWRAGWSMQCHRNKSHPDFKWCLGKLWAGTTGLQGRHKFKAYRDLWPPFCTDMTKWLVPFLSVMQSLLRYCWSINWQFLITVQQVISHSHWVPIKLILSWIWKENHI